MFKRNINQLILNIYQDYKILRIKENFNNNSKLTLSLIELKIIFRKILLE